MEFKKRQKKKTPNHEWRNVPIELYPFLNQLECYGPCFLATKLSEIISSGQMSSKHGKNVLVK